MIAFVVAAPTSGQGKTTVSRSLMSLFTSRGLKVQPFKCGPDYIDTKCHEAVCHRPSINLDTFMATPEHVRQLFSSYSAGADVAIVEGMMGMFDGYDRDRGSTSEIARVLALPVVLVVDARSAAYSMAALLSGFTSFRGGIRTAGVIFNKVGSERHAAMLRQVCHDLKLPCLGCLPKSADLEQASRYLGLDFSQQLDSNAATAILEHHLDIPLLLKAVGKASEPCRNYTVAKPKSLTHLVAARNAESFSFMYQETIDRFPSVMFFDPETDVPDLNNADLLYLPGGYPEKHLEALAANADCRKAIKAYAERGGRIVAECGGMMYLCDKIVADVGDYPMCGVLPYSITARNADRKLLLGYRQFTLDGHHYRGHEFHYTQFLGTKPPSATQVFNAKGEPVDTPVVRYKNVLASYTHLYTMLPDDVEADAHSREAAPHGRPAALHPVMLAGTGSDVGKSVIATALCRIFLQDGYHPAPFKAQNMALNSYATPEGLEIGRAQAVQAEAAGIDCHTDMNPLLLKPNSDHTSQVVLYGKPIGNKSAYDFWRKPTQALPKGGMSDTKGSHVTTHPSLGEGLGGLIDFRKEVCDAYDRLAARYNPIVMEGAGSVSELNLRDHDLVNLPMARHAKADVILVADIDRGGVFASVYGSIALQTPEDRSMIKGIIINKFRGDLRLFDEGRTMLEQICGVPVLGVVPCFSNIYIDEEDSVSLEQKRRKLAEGKVNVAVVLLRHISNFTDFDTLERDPRVNLFYTSNTNDLSHADIIVLPGTKSTLDDLLELRHNGCAQAIVGAHRNGKMVVGICGGYQMLGLTVEDPEGIEGSVASMPGLGLLPMRTVMTAEKTTRQVTFMFFGHECHGYEIHQGVSTMVDKASDVKLGSFTHSDHCIGTYIHGFFDNAPILDYLLKPFATQSATASQSAPASLSAFKQRQYDLLADHVRQHVDIDRLYQILGKPDD